MNTDIYQGCPECYKVFPRSEMKKALYVTMNIYVYFCKDCAKDCIDSAGHVITE